MFVVYVISDYLLISMSIFYYNYMGTARSTEIRDRLQQQTLIMSTDIRKFRPYEGWHILSRLHTRWISHKGYLPDGFPNQSSLSLGPSWLKRRTKNDVTWFVP